MSVLRIEGLNIVISLICLFFIHRQTRKLDRRAGTVTERIDVFDALKGICIVGVVFIHTAYLSPYSTYIYRSLDFAVPFFFISSGFLLAVRCKGSVDLRSYYRNLFFRVVLIYLIFVVGTRMLNGGEMSLQAVLRDALLGRTNFNYYFIPILLQFYMLFPLLIKYRERFDSTFIFCMVALFSFLSFVGNHYIEQPYWDSNPYYLVFLGKDFSYFCFGIFLSLHDISGLRFRNSLFSLLVFVVGAAGLMLSAGEFLLTYAYPFAAFIFAMSAYNLIKGQRWLQIMVDLGRYSLVIYLVHSTIKGGLVMKFFSNEARPWALEFMVISAVTIVLSYGFARVFMACYNPAVAFCLSIIRKPAGDKEDGCRR
ncbi:MAG: acyltransferase [Desulfocapsaceae bacterium]|nr:acyltransferase [Desulfocapsaceae bacterium]